MFPQDYAAFSGSDGLVLHHQTGGINKSGQAFAYGYFSQNSDEIVFDYKLRFPTGYVFDGVGDGQRPMHVTYVFAGAFQSPTTNDLTFYMDIKDNANRTPVLVIRSYNQPDGLQYGTGNEINERVWTQIPYNIATPSDTATNTWYTIKIRLKMNTFTGTTPNEDGVIEFWVDSVLITQYTTAILRIYNFRDIEFDKILLGANYHDELSVAQEIHFDEVRATDLATAVTLTGDAIPGGITETDIVSSGTTIVGTVAVDTLVATFGSDNQITTDFIDGWNSAQSESGGWNAKIRDVLTHTAVTRDTANQFTFVIPPTGDYVITASETITLTVPASSLTGGIEIVATPSLVTISEAGASNTVGKGVYQSGGAAFRHQSGGGRIITP
jgi:hypothetical protein